MSAIAAFPFPLRLENRPGPYQSKPFILTAPFAYERPNGDVIEAPEGFETDFASVPRFFHRIFPPIGHYSWAAVIHDYLCEEKPKRMSSKEAAKVFEEAMSDLGVNAFKRKTMYNAVRWFGPKFKKGDV